jgi:DNA-binding GntR family transcriptional regulator
MRLHLQRRERLMSRASGEVYRIVRQQILTGQLEPGEQVKEEILADICGVSRTPVRDALKRLELQMLVRRLSRRTFVCEWSAADAEELFSLRALLEGYAAARAARLRSEQNLERLRHHHAAIAAALDSITTDPRGFDVDSFIEGNRRFHRTIIEAAGSRRLTETLARLVEQPIILRTAFAYSRDDALISHHQHEDLIRAMTQRDSEWAKATMTAHLQRAAHALSAGPGEVLPSATEFIR